jgi:oligopeptide/dipeptide ABC transporter ATP-binding protein
MYLGSVVEIGPTAALFAAPAHPYTAALLAAVPKLSAAFGSARPESAVRGEVPSPIDPPSGCRFHPRCPNARTLCREARPALLPVNTERQVACHFPL